MSSSSASSNPLRDRLDTIVRDVSRMIVLAATYFCLARISYLLTTPIHQTPIIWFGPAIGVVALVIFGLRLAPTKISS